MQVPFMDLGRQYRALEKDISPRLQAVMNSGRFILGDEVTEFEKAFAGFCGSTDAVGVSSGLDALRLALKAAGIGPGDEVITAANTYIATALAVSGVGATPVLVDVNADTYNIDVSQLEAAITSRTRALIPVDLYGQPADLDGVSRIAQAHGLTVIEDASQAHGALYQGRRTGSGPGLGAFSLYPGKNLGAYGDAGIITTDDPGAAEILRALRNYGSRKKYYHDELGENSRLDTLQAAVLLAKLPHLDDWNAARVRRAARYTEALAGVGDIVTPHVASYAQPVFHLYVIQTARRDALQHHLVENGVACLIHYPIPIHLQKAYREAGWHEGRFPVTERLARRILSLPLFPEMTDSEQKHVIDMLRVFFDSSEGNA